MNASSWSSILRFLLSGLFISIFCVNALAATGRAVMTEKAIQDVGWSALYLGNSYDMASNTTTFSYVMTTASWEKDLSHWVLGMSTEEVPESNQTNTSYGLDPTTGVYGFKWDNGQQAGTTMTYTVTFHGHIAEATTVYSVKGGTYYAVDEITGPGEIIQPPLTTHSISGYIYVDANNDASFSYGEPAIGNVTVSLFDASGAYITSVITSADGYYRFEGLMNGNFQVMIQSSTLSTEDFNEHLFEYFLGADRIMNMSVLNQNVLNQNLPVSMVAASIMDDINSSDPDADGFTFQGSGKTIGYWKHQHRVALTGKGRPHVDKATLMAYLASIESLWLVDPFQFSDGNEIQHADTILSMTSSEAVDLLNKQLLGTELNHVAGQGISNAMALQGIVLNWAEYLSANSGYFSRDELLVAKDLCDSINNSGE